MVPREISEVFHLKQDEVMPLPHRSFREGVQGKSLEKALQNLIATNPEIIAGSQIRPGAEPPLSFATLGQEVPVKGQSLDVLLVDQEAILTLVECKLVDNLDSRRKVLGQILDYAAGAVEDWTDGKLRQVASENYSGETVSVEEVITDLTEDEVDLDQFWQEVEENLDQRRMRLMIAANRLRPAIRRVIEFLNTELGSIEFLGLEVSCYGRSQDSLILVPRLIGQTQSTTPDSKSRLWTYSALKEHYEQMQGKTGDYLLRILDWARETDTIEVARRQNPSFGIEGRHGQRIMTFWSGGSSYCFMEPERYGGSEEVRDRFIDELNQLPIYNFDPSGVKVGRTADGSLDQLKEEELEQLLNILDRHCPEG